MMELTPKMFHSLNDTFQSMTDVQTAMQALQEAEVFRQNLGEFGTDMARRATIDAKTSPCKSNSVRHCCFSVANFKYIGQ
jgi:hypothetical protein